MERIQNNMLYQQYIAKKKLLESQNPKGTQNERELWHGTEHYAVSSINSFGFDRSYCGKNGKMNIYYIRYIHIRYVEGQKTVKKIWMKKIINCPSCTSSINSYGLLRKYCCGNGKNCLR